MDGERLAADTHDDGVGNGQRQRQLDDEARALCGGGVERQTSTQLLNRRLHDRHAHSAPAGAIRFVARRESGRAQNVEQLVGVRRAVGHWESGAAAALDDLRPVHAAAVVTHLDHHGIADAGGGERDRALRRFAHGAPLGRRFDAVTDGVSHQMNDGIEHALDQELVDLGVLPVNLEPHVLAQLAREIADHERHPPEDLADRHQAHPHDALAKIAQLPFDGEAVFLHRPEFDRRHARLEASE